MLEIEDTADEIDLREMFSALLGGWIIITSSALIFTSMAIYYALFIARKDFSTAKIEFLLQSNQSSMGSLGGLASLAGVSLPSNANVSVKLQPRLESTAFILELNDMVNLFSDPYFNPFIMDKDNQGDQLGTV